MGAEIGATGVFPHLRKTIVPGTGSPPSGPPPPRSRSPTVPSRLCSRPCAQHHEHRFPAPPTPAPSPMAANNQNVANHPSETNLYLCTLGKFERPLGWIALKIRETPDSRWSQAYCNDRPSSTQSKSNTPMGWGGVGGVGCWGVVLGRCSMRNYRAAMFPPPRNARGGAQERVGRPGET